MDLDARKSQCLANLYFISFRYEDNEWVCFFRVYNLPYTIVKSAYEALLRLCEKHIPDWLEFQIVPASEISMSAIEVFTQDWLDSAERVGELNESRALSPSDFEPVDADLILLTIGDVLRVLMEREKHRHSHQGENDELQESEVPASIIAALKALPRRVTETERHDVLDANERANTIDRANNFKLFPDGLIDDPVIEELIFELHKNACLPEEQRQSQKSIARHLSTKHYRKATKAESLLAAARRLRKAGKVTF